MKTSVKKVLSTLMMLAMVCALVMQLTPVAVLALDEADSAGDELPVEIKAEDNQTEPAAGESSVAQIAADPVNEDSLGQVDLSEHAEEATMPEAEEPVELAESEADKLTGSPTTIRGEEPLETTTNAKERKAPVEPVLTATTEGSFYFLAVAGTDLVARPIQVPYVVGDTIVTALNKTAYAFVGLDADKVTSVNGTDGTYIWSSSGTADLVSLDATPEPLAGQLLVFRVGEDAIRVSQNLLLLITEVLRYEDSTIAQDYVVARNLYRGILRDLPTLLEDDVRAKELYQNLKKAIDEAEIQADLSKYAITLNLKHGGEVAEEISISFTNRFGSTVTAAHGDTVELIAGDHSFTASLPSLKKVAKGTLTVEETTEAQDFRLDIPGDDYWFANVGLGVTRNSPITYYEPTSGLVLDIPIIDCYPYTQLRVGHDWSSATEGYTRQATVIYKQTNNDAERRANVSAGAKRMNTLLSFFIPEDGGSRQEDYVATLTDMERNVVFTQEYTINLIRPRTLANLQVLEKSGALPLEPIFAAETYEYTVKALDSSTSLDILPTAFAGYENGYAVYVNDDLVAEGEAAKVELKPADQEQDPIIVQVRHADGTVSKEYTIKPILVPAASVKISVPKGADLSVTNSVGAEADYVELNRRSSNFDVYTFDLASGLPYDFVVTKNIHYRTKGSFVAADDVAIETTVDTRTWVSAIVMETRTGSISDTFIDISGDEVSHEISRIIPDYYPNCRMKVSLKDDYASADIKAEYLRQTTISRTNNQPHAVSLRNGASNTTNLANCICRSGRSQAIELVVSQEVAGLIHEQVYNVSLKRSLHLDPDTSLAPSFAYDDGTIAAYTPSFDCDQLSGYEVIVPESASEILIKLRQHISTVAEDIELPYTITINGVPTNEVPGPTSNTPLRQALISLNGTAADEDLVVSLSNPYGGVGEYTFTVKKAQSLAMTFGLEPEDAILCLYDDAGNQVWPEADDSYNLLVGAAYKYVLTKAGYVSLTDTFVAAPDLDHLDLVLEAAPVNEAIDPTIDVEWNKFRGEDNTGTTARETPKSPAEAQLHWAYKSSMMSNMGQPIVLDSYVAVTTRNKLQYLDMVSGELVAEGVIVSAGGIVPVYADGMIFVPIANGLQAFNATPRPQTEEDVGYTNKDVMVLDSLWVYRDPIGGAGTTPFYVKDGYIYGGWQQVRNNGAFVCLSITDEDPTKTHEEKQPTWRWVRGTGFYWAGAHVDEKFVVVGGEMSGDDDLTCLDAKTGRVLDSIPYLFTVENRGSVSYAEDLDRYCLVTKDTFITVRVDENGKFYDLKQGSLGGMSTSTPAIYNGRAYIGISGTGQFQSFTGSGIMVLDIATAQPIYAMKTRGYPQSSGLVSTAYLDVPHYNPQTGQEETGFVYVYFTENINPGNVSYIIDKPGITEPVLFDNVGGIETAPLLFIPKGGHAQYNLSSLQVDKYGTMYMKTDSAFIMAIGHKIEEIELREEPDKTVYYPGDVFDPTGIKVVLKYCNGLERDVSDYVKFNEKPLLVEQTSIDVTFPYALYNNETPNDYIDSRWDTTFDKLPRPTVAVPINVLSDDEIRSVEDIIVLIEEIGTVEYTEESKAKINQARRAYESTDPLIRPAIRNYQELLDAEARYDLLEQAAKGRLPAAEVVKDMDRLGVEIKGPVVFNIDEEVKKDLLQSFTLNLEELEAVEAGKDITIGIEAKELDSIPEAEKFFVDVFLQDTKNLEAMDYVLDIKLYKQVEGCDKTYISNLYGNSEVQLEIPLPTEYQAAVAGRGYFMLNVHGSIVHKLKDQSETAETVLITTGRFSTYILAKTSTSWLKPTPDGERPTPTPIKPEANIPNGDKFSFPIHPDSSGRLPTGMTAKPDGIDGIGRQSTDDGSLRLLAAERERGLQLAVRDSDWVARDSEGAKTRQSSPEDAEEGELKEAKLKESEPKESEPKKADPEELESDGNDHVQKADVPAGQQVIEEEGKVSKDEVKVLSQAGENLGLVILISAIGLAIIALAVVRYKRMNKKGEAA